MPVICGICRENECDFLTRCQHYFHENCLNMWGKLKKECPLCRGHFSLSKKMEIIMGGFIDNKDDFMSFNSDILGPIIFQLCANSDIQFNSIFERLIDLKWDFNTTNECGSTILHELCKSGNLQSLNRLLELNVDILAADNEGYLAIHYACKGGHLNIIDRLLAFDRKLDVNIINRLNGMSCLHLAIKHNYYEVSETLILNFGADVNLPDLNGLIPMNFACENGSLKLVNLLFEHGSLVNTNGISPLHSATFSGHLSIVELLIDSAGADPNLADEFGQTALHLASCFGFVAIANKLIGSGAQVNIKGAFGRYPIHYACSNNNTEMLQSLILNGSEVDVSDDLGVTPLHIACKCGNTSLIGILLQNGANQNKLNCFVDFPLHFAQEFRYEDIVPRLMASKE